MACITNINNIAIKAIQKHFSPTSKVKVDKMLSIDKKYILSEGFPVTKSVSQGSYLSWWGCEEIMQLITLYKPNFPNDEVVLI